MLVYGDRVRSEAPTRLTERIAALIAKARASPSPTEAHDQLVAALIEAGMLAQGLADVAFEMRGCDGDDPLAALAMELALCLARAVGKSWDGATARTDAVHRRLESVNALLPLTPIAVKQPEGYAYYSVYPELYYEAARGLPADTRVIGVRSIGTSLAAMVTVGAGGFAPPLTLRPVGHPFARHYAIDDACWRRLLHQGAGYALVDEGPGLSGSSFGALADRLEDAGIDGQAIVIVPGHAGDVGPEASARHRARWRQVERRTASFECHVLPRLADAVEDLTGPRLGPLEDVSAGRWRNHAGSDGAVWPPVNAVQERRKYLSHTASGCFLLKFAGFGSFGQAALSDARLLHGAGFGPEPLGLRLGFLVMRWEPPAAGWSSPWESRAQCVALLGSYLGFRATLPADDANGADLAALATMTAQNITESLGAAAAMTWRRRYGQTGSLARPRPVRTDNRLHTWEWIRTARGVVLKADATDHCRAHDLVGCQDIAWDLAGAGVEFDLTPEERDAMITAVESSGNVFVDRTLVDWLTPAYLAFQLGSWTLALQQSSGEDRTRIDELLRTYRRALRAAIDAG